MQELLNQEQDYQITFIIDTLIKVKILSNDDVWPHLILSFDQNENLKSIGNLLIFVKTLPYQDITQKYQQCSKEVVSIINELWQKSDSSCKENKQLSLVKEKLRIFLKASARDMKALIKCLYPLDTSYDELAKIFNFIKLSKTLEAILHTRFSLSEFERLFDIMQPLLVAKFFSNEELSIVESDSYKLKMLPTDNLHDRLKAALVSICDYNDDKTIGKYHELVVCILSSLRNKEDSLLYNFLVDHCKQALYAFASTHTTNFPKIAGLLLQIALLLPSDPNFTESLKSALYKLYMVVTMSTDKSSPEIFYRSTISCSTANCSTAMFYGISNPRILANEFCKVIIAKIIPPIQSSESSNTLGKILKEEEKKAEKELNWLDIPIEEKSTDDNSWQTIKH